MRTRPALFALLSLLLLVNINPALPPMLSTRQAAANSNRPDLAEITKEVMAFRIEGGQTHLAMWLPYEFFLAAGLAEGKSSAQDLERQLGFLRPYVIILGNSSVERPDGSETYATEAEMRKRAALKLPDGSEVAPLAVLPPQVTAVATAMKSSMAAEGGADRQNMHLLIFPAATATGKVVVNTSGKDSLTLLLKADGAFRENAFTWRTPFDSMTSAPPCPRCKVAMSAKWSYCPYDGQKLP